MRCEVNVIKNPPQKVFKWFKKNKWLKENKWPKEILWLKEKEALGFEIWLTWKWDEIKMKNINFK